MRTVSGTDAGKIRTINEDAVFVDEGKGIFLLADGMGGHQAGEVASGLAVRKTYIYLKDRVSQTVDGNIISNLLIDAIRYAHNALSEKSLTDDKLRGMGTTIVAAVIKDYEACICHVGDSRAYLIRDGITRITTDHSFRGHYENDVMLRAPSLQERSHVLAQAVGIGPDIDPDVNHIGLQKGDILLLCSDGLTDMLSDEEIAEVIQNVRDDMDKAAKTLIQAANNRGGRDNISVILIKA